MPALHVETVTRLTQALKRLGYVVYTEPYRMNIVGVRNPNTLANAWDDQFYVWYSTGTSIQLHSLHGTTDPGTFYLNSPLNKDLGTAILAAGQYVDAYALGLHKGKVPALVQVGPVKVHRDYNRDSLLDFTSRIETGRYGINFHPSSDGQGIGRDSAGCQVPQFKSDFARLLPAFEQHAKRYGNKFTYTLIDLRELKRQKQRTAGLGLLAFSGGVSLLLFWESIARALT